MTPQVINIITNVLAALAVLYEPVTAYLQSQPFSWSTFGLCILLALVNWFTGKSTLSTLPKDK